MRVSKAPEERRAELIEAARFLFDQKGVEKTRVSDIVSHIGVAQGVFYYYFASKDEMIDVVVEQVKNEIEGIANTILQDADKPFAEKIANFIELYLDLFDQFLGDEETNAKGLSASPLVEHFMAQQEQTLFAAHLQGLVQQGVTSGEVTAPYPEVSILVLLHGFKAYATQSLPTRPMIYSIVEQTLGIKKGSLVAYKSHKMDKKLLRKKILKNNKNGEIIA